MPKVIVDKVIPDLKVQATGGLEFKLSKLKGNPVILYFYPKDNTPGCTREGEDFRDQYRKFQRRKIMVFGVSRDTLASHEKFKEKYRFPFDLIADPEDQGKKYVWQKGPGYRTQHFFNRQQRRVTQGIPQG